VPVGVVAGDLHARALDAGDFALGLLQDLGPVALALAVAQVHPQQHRRPVLRLGSAAPGLDVDEAGVGVHRIVKHPAELHVADGVLERVDVLRHRDQHRIVGLAARQLEELAAVLQARIEVVQRPDDGLELLAFLAELLGPLGIVPDPGILQGARHRAKALGLDLEVKDTSVDRQPVAAIRTGSRRSG